jgi:DNA-binding MarR family transcriptional regulator
VTDWLNETEKRAWMALLAFHLLGVPELDRTFRPYGLVHVEYGLLAALTDGPDEGLRMSELAARMNMSPSRLSHRMRKLIELGYVDVTGSTCDGRVTIARITDAGLEFAARVAPDHVHDVRRLLFDHLTPEQVSALADALGVVASRLVGCPTPTDGKSSPPRDAEEE